ncbi:hypothetical protein K4A83_08405 [Spirulina subsalsa FACHB-351]|uniref:Uncharacterized protein n=1 Tax=Spirulina subsalsa FACHB-351 TaxID=234711 RepID=A0ABT3L465_9CYAN|nr:hypothetical protein [Spirulina subsalsa]MCW6036292.1 hypothetical protein [Spirulina subsalsa FACHB-351]
MLEQLRQEIETLSLEEQEYILNIVHSLQQQRQSPAESTPPKTLCEKLQEKGLIGYSDDDPDVSTHYKSLVNKPNMLEKSPQEILAMPLTERYQYLEQFIPAMVEDFAQDPELTEFNVLDTEDWE